MLTTSEKNTIKKILKPSPAKKAELQTLLDAVVDNEVETDIRVSLQQYIAVKTSVNSPRKIGLKRAGVIEWDGGVICHQSNKIFAEIKSDLAIVLGWELEELIEAF